MKKPRAIGRAGLMILAAVVAMEQIGCKPPRALFVNAKMTKSSSGGCEVLLANVDPNPLKEVRPGDLIIWVIKNRDCYPYRAAVLTAPGDDPLDSACVRYTSNIEMGDLGLVGCVVVGKTRRQPYKYEIDVGKSFDERPPWRGDLEVQVWP